MKSDPDTKKLDKQKRKQLKLEMEAVELKIKSLKAIELESKQLKGKRKEIIEQGNSSGMYGTQSEPRKALSSYLRNQNKAEVSIISILDKKAAILIRICTALISGLVVFNSYIEENVIYGHLISHILLIGMLVTLVCAILATKPVGKIMKSIFRKKIEEGHANTEDNIFFLTQDISLKEYEAAMVKVVNSQDLQIGNQVRANYVLASNNNMKARILDFSYSVFLGSFVVVGLVSIFCRYF